MASFAGISAFLGASARGGARSRRRLGLRLVAGLSLMSAAGLLAMFAIVNTAVRGVMHGNALVAAYRNKVIAAGEIDAWLGGAAQATRALAIALGALPSEEGFAAVAEGFVAGFGFVDNALVGFEDGRVVNGVGWDPPEGWLSHERPWYAAAMAAPAGELAVSRPYVSYATGSAAIAMSVWVEGLRAVVGTVIAIDSVLGKVASHEVIGGGYLILAGPADEVIAHPRHPPARVGEGISLADLPGGGFLAERVAAGAGYGEFRDSYLGPAYFVSVPLEAAGWTLIAVIPAGAMRGPVLRYIAAVMLTLALLLMAVFAFAAFFFLRLTRNMEESSAAAERLRLIFDSMPMAANVRDRGSGILGCNAEAPKVFGLRDKEEYLARFHELSPELQPDGEPSRAKAEALIRAAFDTGRQRFEWMHQTLSGEPVPCDVTLIRAGFRDGDFLLAFVKDLREERKAREKERMGMQRLHILLDASPLACCITDFESNVLDCNSAAVELFGLKDKREFAERFFELSPEVQPDGTPSKTRLQWIEKQTFETRRIRFEWTHQTLAGRLIPCDVIMERMTFGGKDVKVGYLRDLRDFYKYRETERLAQQRLQAMLDSSPLACAITDENLNVLEANWEILALFEMTDKQAFAESYLGFSPRYQPDGRLSQEKLMEKVRLVLESGRARFEWMYQTLGGKPIPSEVTVVKVTLDGKNLLISYTRDLREISETAAMVKQLERLAFTDSLTGARNRRYFTEAAERELRSCVMEERDFSIALLDIDHFKRVNDTYGHGIGDDVLKILAARARHSLKEDTLFARYGGEEFVIMLPGVNHKDAVKVAWQLQKKMEDSPFVTDGLEISITISLGVASRTPANEPLQDIIRNADMALYHAKETGRNRVVSHAEAFGA